MKYKERPYTATKERYGKKTKYQNLGMDPAELDQKSINFLRLKKDISKLKVVLGPELFIRWLYESNIISFKEYNKIRPATVNPNETEIDYDKIVEITYNGQANEW